MPTCTRCKAPKTLEDMVKTSVTKRGYQSWCKACTRAYMADRRLRHSEQIRASHRRRLGLPEPSRPRPTECECCGQPEQLKRALGLDHCHETGAFRGWLCVGCNVSIGRLGDSKAGLLRALAYLERASA